MDFLRKQAKENFRHRLEAMHEKKRQARLLLGLTKPKIAPIVIDVVKMPKPKRLLFKPVRAARMTSFPGRWSDPKEVWVKSAFSSGFGFQKHLEKKGWKVLGRGAYSTVMARSETSTKVLKITNRPDNWIDYIQWAAKKGYMGRFAPTVYSFKVVKGKKQDFFLSSVERMQDTLHRVGSETDASLTYDLFHKYLYYKNTMSGVFLEEMVPGLAAFALELKKEFSDGLDLHAGNIMVRKDGSFVVTDPVADGGKRQTVTRLKAKDLTFAGYSIYLKVKLLYDKDNPLH